MATLINNAGVQHYANKMVLAENRKVGSKSLPTALADIDNLIDEMKTQFDAEYGSALDMKLENNENAFSVGTGTNIDKRSEVENSFTDVELSGNSLVNLFDYDGVSCLNLKHNLDGSFTNISCTWDYNIKMLNSNILKPNTLYTLVLEVTNWTYSGRIQFRNSLSSNLPIINNTFDISTSGKFLILCRSIDPIDTSKTTIIFKGSDPSTTTGSFTLKPIILEGDWTNKPIPQYFEGLKSVGEKEDGNHKISISSVGKNLLKLNLASFEYNGIRGTRSGDKLILNGTCTERFTARLTPNKFNSAGNPFNLEKNSTYTLSSNYTKGRVNIMQYDTWNIALSKRETATSLTGIIPTDACDNLFAYIIIEKGLSFNNEEFWFMLEKTNSFTSYEPYKEDKKEISLNEPLRGLPNGVKDTIEKVNGEWKIVRRCGEIIFNGEEDWILSDHNSETTSRYRLYLKITDIAKKTNSIGICDTIPVYLNSYWRQDFEMIENDATFINIRKKIYNNLNEFKEWLSQNPTKIVYELETPIIEDISPVTLQCWKNGTISIDEVLPVETTHTVALNKPAQIKRNIEELTALRKRVQALENQYDQIALEQAHQLSLINHSIELDYDI